MFQGALTRWQTARGRGPFFLLILLGAISVLGHAPFFIAPAFILSFALFWIRIDAVSRWDDRPKRAVFWSGWAFAFGYFLAGLYWIGSAFLVRGGVYVWIMPLCVVVLPALLSLFWAFAASLYARLRVTHLGVSALIFAVVIGAAEWLRGHILTGFPWNLPGYIFEGGNPISQSASLFGIYGLTLLTLLLGAAFGPALIDTRKHFVAPTVCLAVFAGLFVWGHMRLNTHSDVEMTDLNIRVVQAAIDQTRKFDPEYYNEIVTRYTELTRSAGLDTIDVIIWPEGAIPGLVLERREVMDAIVSALRPGQTLVLGVTRRDLEGRYYNSMAAITVGADGSAGLSALYDKRRLVPFGEYFPGGGLIEKLDMPTLSAAVASFTKGETGLFAPPGLPPASAQICYEIIFPGFTDLSTEPQPDYILNISNDAWYGRSTGPWQHLNQVRYRAIETGLPVVRSASNGVSGVIDPLGRRLNDTSPYALTVIDTVLPAPL
ncbi:apolipoprotein N-acyltransferase [Robiginitomaculum antarcticum]|uniref:apolipoprotein N-acyltransferase n=1 Tax=Robiginitomaculum antarcticum TaxID=437507 RepID=UPI0003808918|nr:apolipoprotein N-acyltransferase [Robiginitomaculum antarcticum]